MFLIYNISNKTTFMDTVPLPVKFNEVDGFIKIYGGVRYLVLFSYLYDEICNWIKYLITEKCGITYSSNYNFAKIRIDSYNSLFNSLSQSLMRIKINTTIIYFSKRFI